MGKVNIDRRRAMLLSAAVGSALVFTYTLWPANTPPSRVTSVPAGANAQPAAAPAANAQPAPRLSAAELSAWGGLYRITRRDPFFTAVEIAAMNRPSAIGRPSPVGPVAAPAQPPLPAYTVKLVMTAGSERMATIGDQVLKVGDRLGEERVVEILPDAVVLARGGERRRLELGTGGPTAAGLIQLERVR